jgi:3-methyl-2-oxobutanoate hydroxymethyltransferase
MATIKDLQDKKVRGQKITSLTAYDYTTAQILEAAGIDMILVGDSLGMVVYGYDSTVYVTMDDMIRHTRAVVRGVTKTLVIADMPFGAYHASIEEAVHNAVSLIQAGAKGVKVEGATPFVLEVIRRLTESGILVVAHLGFTPQQINRFGGYFVQGRDEAADTGLLHDATAVVQAGAQMVVLEMVPGSLATTITGSISVPTIGIGAGRGCNGQVLVVDDLLGLYSNFTPRFVKRYAELATVMKAAVEEYIKDVTDGKFPSKEHTFK